MRNIPFSPVDMSDLEIQAVTEVLKSGWITTGPKTQQFEKALSEYCGVDKTICLNSATASLEMTLRILGVGPGDEVITTAYTYTASASVVCHVGAKLVLVDTKKDSCEIDYDKLADAITEKTKVIISVDIAGIMCDYDKIFEVVEKKKALFKPNNEIQEKFSRVIVLADAAHSFGSYYHGKRSGSVADFSAFSFHAVKNLTCAEGGAAVWKHREDINDDELYKKYRLLALHGQSKDALEKTCKGTWEYDILYPGYKCNMTDIAAAIAYAQLERYETLLKRRFEIIKYYNERLASCNVAVLDHFNETRHSNGHVYAVRVIGADEMKRNEIITEMAERGISTNVHFKPLPMHTAYKNLGFSIKDFPNAYDFYKNEISLPLNTKITDEETEYVMDQFIDIISKI